MEPVAEAVEDDTDGSGARKLPGASMESGEALPPARKWIKLSEYAEQKTVEVEDVDIARELIVQEFKRESEWLLPFRYKRGDDIEGRWHEEGLPLWYYWCHATINWSASSASWPERIAGLELRLSLKIYNIEVAVPVIGSEAPALTDQAITEKIGQTAEAPTPSTSKRRFPPPWPTSRRPCQHRPTRRSRPRRRPMSRSSNTTRESSG